MELTLINCPSHLPCSTMGIDSEREGTCSPQSHHVLQNENFDCIAGCSRACCELGGCVCVCGCVCLGPLCRLHSFACWLAELQLPGGVLADLRAAVIPSSLTSDFLIRFFCNSGH